MLSALFLLLFLPTQSLLQQHIDVLLLYTQSGYSRALCLQGLQSLQSISVYRYDVGLLLSVTSDRMLLMSKSWTLHNSRLCSACLIQKQASASPDITFSVTRSLDSWACDKFPPSLPLCLGCGWRTSITSSPPKYVLPPWDLLSLYGSAHAMVTILPNTWHATNWRGLAQMLLQSGQCFSMGLAGMPMLSKMAYLMILRGWLLSLGLMAVSWRIGDVSKQLNNWRAQWLMWQSVCPSAATHVPLTFFPFSAHLRYGLYLFPTRACPFGTG